ncbi:cyclin-like protein [Rhodotorula diobovata]|uniref:Cyclin-like protein n=1 Tax=Rhodotorula diobovata TaxID=5288 RepID=A0A5C5FT85_9BASI|nr:cyclin-like protein [Rhodotorula diobovata]
MAVQLDRDGPSTPKRQPVQLYHLSSQYRHWRFSKEQLAKIRQDLIEQAVERVRTLWEEERAQQAQAGANGVPAPTDASASEPPSQPATPPAPSDIEYLSVADEQLLVAYYLQQAVGLCGAFKFPEAVSATALSYLKRFYLRNTAMDYHPKDIMLTCVFLATKTENYPISIDTFAAKVKVAPADILALEFLVSQSLHFEYKVHHAYLALSGLVLDMQTTSVPSPSLASALPRAQAFLRAARLSPAELVYAPSQIALACMRLADREAVETWLEEKLRAGAAVPREGRDGGGEGRKEEGGEGGAPGREEGEPAQLAQEELLRLLDEVQAMIQEQQRSTVDKNKVREVDRRLKWARNPEKDPKSALYKKRKAEEEAAREEKERAKAAKRPPNDDASVFD